MIEKKEDKKISAIPDGMEIKDLSVEKRIELYQKVLKDFDTEMSATFGVSLGAEIKFSPKGIVPVIVLIDLLAKKNEPQNPEAPKENPKV